MDISHIPLALKAKTSSGEWGADFQFISSSSFPTYLKCNTYIENLGNISLKKVMMTMR